MSDKVQEGDSPAGTAYPSYIRLLPLLPFFLIGLVFCYNEILPYFAARYGTAGQAVVMDKWMAQGGRYMPYKVQLNYDAGTAEETQRLTVPKDFYESLAVGQVIRVHYLFRDPDCLALDGAPPTFWGSFGFLLFLLVFSAVIYYWKLRPKPRPNDFKD